MGEFVRVRRIESPDEFLDALRPHKSPWSTGRWLFRGHWNADAWKLVPRLWRQENFEFIERAIELGMPGACETVRKHSESAAERKGGYDPPVLYKHIMYNLGERELLRQFAELADDIGLDSPDELLRGPPSLQDVSAYCSGIRKRDLGDGWPNPCVRQSPFVALAQHHRLPTRLLDWTRNGLLAAHFAASGYLGKQMSNRTPSYFRVWALNLDELDNRLSGHLRHIRVPAKGNERIRTQESRFTETVCETHAFLSHNGWPTIEDKIADITANHAWGCESNPDAILQGIDCPTQHARDLLMLLRNERVTLAHLMPGYDSVAQELASRWELPQDLGITSGRSPA